MIQRFKSIQSASKKQFYSQSQHQFQSTILSSSSSSSSDINNTNNNKNNNNSAEINLSDMSIEELVAMAASDKVSTIYREQSEKIASKKSLKKKREDKEYEAYWNRRQQTPKDGSKAALLKEKAISKAYYSIKENPELAKALTSINSDDDNNVTNQVLTNRKLPKFAIFLSSALLAGTFLFLILHKLSEYSQSLTAPVNL